MSSLPGTAYSRDTEPVTHRQPTTSPGWWRFFLAALAAALVALLGAGTASAATVPNLETRVGASTPVAAYVVGVHESVSAGQRWAKAPPQAGTVVGFGVAANAAPKVAGVPKLAGGSLQEVGGPIWGHGNPAGLLGTRSPEVLRGLASRSDAVKLRDLYQAAADAGRGGATAPIRVRLAQEIIDAWG